MKKQDRIYVAGNTGLVGSAIVRSLENQGYENLLFSPWQQYDLRNQATVVSFFEKNKPDYVIIAAAKVGGIYANEHYPAEFMAANLTRNISEMDKITVQMEECRRMKIKVLGPDVNESYNDFTVNKKGNIRKIILTAKPEKTKVITLSEYFKSHNSFLIFVILEV